MMELVHDLAVDPTSAPDRDSNIFRQVMVNTHSPGVVQLCSPADLLLAESRPFRTEGGVVTRALSLAPFRASWRADSASHTFSEADVVAYLAAPPGAQLKLPLGRLDVTGAVTALESWRRLSADVEHAAQLLADRS